MWARSLVGGMRGSHAWVFLSLSRLLPPPSPQGTQRTRRVCSPRVPWQVRCCHHVPSACCTRKSAPYFKEGFIVRGGGRKQEREGEKYGCVRETLVGCLSCAPRQGLNPQPRHLCDQELNWRPFSLRDHAHPTAPHRPVHIFLCFIPKRFCLFI